MVYEALKNSSSHKWIKHIQWTVRSNRTNKWANVSESGCQRNKEIADLQDYTLRNQPGHISLHHVVAVLISLYSHSS